MAQSATAALAFAPPAPLPLAVDFLGGRLTSDGGWSWVAEADAALGLCATLAAACPIWRRRRGPAHGAGPAAPTHLSDRRRLRGPGRCRHLAPRSAAEAGLRPACRTTRSRSGQPADLLAAWRMRSRRGTATAWRGLGRGLSGGAGTGRACRRTSCSIWTAPTIRRMGSRKAAPITATSASTCTTPCSSSTASTGQFITAVLRPGTAHAGAGALAILKRMVRRVAGALAAGGDRAARRCRLRQAARSTPTARERGSPTPSAWSPMPAWSSCAAPARRRDAGAAGRGGGREGAPAGGDRYQAGSWPTPRRVIIKAEALAKGPNTRFVVTTRDRSRRRRSTPGTPTAARRRTGSRISKTACFGDRLSCHRFWANQVRLLLHGAAYWLLDTLRRWLVPAGTARMQLATVRLRLIKIGGRVRQLATRVHLRLASSHPGEPLWHRLATREGRS